jgi:hypothetical protein
MKALERCQLKVCEVQGDLLTVMVHCLDFV